jgi:uncharacterized protein (DUF2252 family)
MKFKQPRPRLRSKILLRAQQLKMARSAHAYVRGNTIRFYEWLDTTKTRVPQGPPIWICGDCHIGNLGPVADSKGKVEIEIRDLDQTVIGNPAHDLIRLALSLSMAARSSDLPGVTTALMMDYMMTGYCDAINPVKMAQRVPKKSDKVIRTVLKQAMHRSWRNLATERLEDVRPTIPLGKRFWALTKAEKESIRELFELAEVKTLITCLRERDENDPIEVLDAAYWMKGCSSLGRLRYAVLIGVGKSLCLIDIKEATPAAAPGRNTPGTPRNAAQRLVAGARALSPFLGERMVAARINGASVVIRELRPQDMKFEFDRITQAEALTTARFLASVVGKAHARQMDVATRKKWLAQLNKNQTKALGAPSWLWQCVVELVAAHELAYLEHCRRYALSAQTGRQAG